MLHTKTNDRPNEPSDSDRNYIAWDGDDEVIDTTPERKPEPERRYPQRDRTARRDAWAHYQTGTASKKSARKPRKQDEDELNKMDFWYSWYKWSDCKLAKRYDEERQFFPQPGPSNLNYYEDDIIPGYYRPMDSKQTPERNYLTIDKAAESRSTAKKRRYSTPPQRNSSLTLAKVQKLNDTKADSPGLFGINSPILSENSDGENDIHMQSFYEQSFVQHNATPTPANGILDEHTSDDVIFNGEINSQGESLSNTTLSTPVISKFLENLKNSSSELKGEGSLRPRRQKAPDTCIIKPKTRAPHSNAAKMALDSHEFPKAMHPVPFYSDPNDVIANNSKKEVGHTVLQLTGNGVADCEEFKSQLNLVGIVKWQRLIGMQALRCSRRIQDSKMLSNEASVRKILAKDKPVLIKPMNRAPSRQEARNWIGMRSRTNQRKQRKSEQCQTMLNGANDDEDSPEKMRREKATAALNECDDDDAKSAPYPMTNGVQNEMIRALRSNKELTVSLVPKRAGKAKILKSQSDDENKITRNNSNGHGSDDDNDDVICLDDVVPAKKTQSINSVSKLVRSTR